MNIGIKSITRDTFWFMLYFNVGIVCYFNIITLPYCRSYHINFDHKMTMQLNENTISRSCIRDKQSYQILMHCCPTVPYYNSPLLTRSNNACTSAVLAIASNVRMDVCHCSNVRPGVQLLQRSVRLQRKAGSLGAVRLGVISGHDRPEQHGVNKLRVPGTSLSTVHVPYTTVHEDKWQFWVCQKPCYACTYFVWSS